MPEGPSMRPTGWFQVAWSADLACGDVRPLRYFATDLVMYRGNDRVVRIHDAHCLHLGASLAHGGCVTDDGIQCPFHGWVWGPDGTNRRIPYQDRPNTARVLGTWSVAERNEGIYLWHDPAGRPPLWEVPDAMSSLPAYTTGRAFYPVHSSHFADLRLHPQAVAENAVDAHHFQFVHGTPVSPIVLDESFDETTWKSVVGFGRRWENFEGPPTETLNTIAILWSGIGFSITAEHTAAGVRLIAINVTPVDDTSSELFASYWIEREDGNDIEHFDRRLGEAMAALPDDLRIWQNQKYLQAPALATSEAGGFVRLRRWAQQFYAA